MLRHTYVIGFELELRRRRMEKAIVQTGLSSMQAASANSLQIADKPTAADFMTKYNPDYIYARCKGMSAGEIASLCYFAKSPTIAELQQEYGENVPIAWLMAQLHGLSEFSGVKDKMDGGTAEHTAFIITSNYYYLKVSEFLLFFHRFKAGRYGRFYGTVDPLIIADALIEFVRERNAAIDARDNQKHINELESQKKNAVKFKEYLEIKRRAENGDIQAKKQLIKPSEK